MIWPLGETHGHSLWEYLEKLDSHTVCSPTINKNLNAEEERFKIHFDGKLIREVLKILKGCLDKMSGERLESFFFFLNK
jgi:hypothetical protein